MSDFRDASGGVTESRVISLNETLLIALTGFKLAI